MTNLPHIAVAILNYNGKDQLAQFLPSVLALTYPNYTVWVIDNRSADGSAGFLASEFPSVHCIHNGGNLGFAEGYNQGLRHIDADYILLLNSDVELNSGCLEPLSAMMEADKYMAFCQPKILSFRHRECFEYAGAGGGRMDGLGYPYCRGRLFNTVEMDSGQYNDATNTIFWTTGAAMLVRPAAFQNLGGFYAFYFMHNEEIDLCWRAQNHGWHIGYCGQSIVYHVGGASLQKENPRKTYFNFRNNLVMLARNMPLGRLIWVLPMRLGLDIVAALQMMAGRQLPNAAAVFKAWIAFLSWLVSPGANKWPGKRGFGNLAGVYKGSIVWQYFVAGKRKL